jgi:hypothetical protein
MGALAAALLVSGLLAGAASGRSAAMSTSIEVFSGDILKQEAKGLVSQVREEAVNAGGTRIGTVRWNCAIGTDYHCTVVYDFKAIAPGGKGTVVATGVFAGFTGETLAVAGGTEAYEGASGSVTYSISGGEFAHTMNLLP